MRRKAYSEDEALDARVDGLFGGRRRLNVREPCLIYFDLELTYYSSEKQRVARRNEETKTSGNDRFSVNGTSHEPVMLPEKNYKLNGGFKKRVHK